MELTLSALQERVLAAYRPYYDIERMDESDAPLVAAAAFHEHEVSYMIVKKAEMWSADRHEYAYFFTVPHLTLELYEQCLDRARELGEPLVKPDANHMSTFLVAVFLCESADDDAVQALKKCRIRKSFQFSLKGWMEVQTALVELGKDSVIANSAGYHTAKFLKNVLFPKPVKRGFLKFNK